MEVLGEGEAEKTKGMHVMQGKTKKFFKTVWDLTLLYKTRDFCDSNDPRASRQNESPKTLQQNLEILFKSFSQLGHPPASKSRKLLSKLATGTSTHDKV